MNKAIAKAGTLLSTSEGCYSDFSVTGFFVVLQDFSPAEQLSTFLAANPGQKGRYNFQTGAFSAYLLRQGLLLEVQYSELHMGDYHSADEVSFRPVGGE